MRHPLIVTLTGASGCGKTTVCERTIALAQSQGCRVTGLLTLPRTSAGLVVGLDLQDIVSGDRVALAEERGPTDGPSTERWHFHRRSLEWGSARLDSASPADLLVIDELGPLELVHRQGWANGVSVIHAGRYRVALVVVRLSLLPLYRLRLPATEAGTIVVGPGNRDRLPRDLANQLERPA